MYNAVNNVEAATDEQTAPTLTVNVTNDTASLDLVVRDDNGTFASSSTSGSDATFTVATNNFTGYTLSIKSSSLSTNLTNTSTNPNSVLETISSSMDSDAFDSSTHNGKWGYLPSKYNSSTNTTTYHPSPTTTGNTLDVTSSANSVANNYTIALGARADYSQPVGTYSNTYILTTVINSFSYSISYNKGNTTDTVTDLPSAQTASATSVSGIAIPSAKPTRGNHAFLGWCSVMPITSNGIDGCNGDVYDSGSTYYFNRTANNSNITLYAMWNYVSGTLQSWNGCSSLSNGQIIYLVDTRDGKVYSVVKLTGSDNAPHCWMREPLRYEGNASGSARTFTASGSNFSSDFTVQYYANSGASLTTPYYYKPNDKNYFYNYCAATAGGICSSSYNGSPVAAADICPAGWHIPTRENYQNNLAGLLSYSKYAEYSYGNPTMYFSKGTAAVNQQYAFRYYPDNPSASEINYGSGSEYGHMIQCVYDLYHVNHTPKVDNASYPTGLSGFTFDVYVNNVLVANDVIDYDAYLDGGSTYRIVANAVTGYYVSYETITIPIVSDYSPAYPSWARRYLQTMSFSECTSDGTYAFDARDNNLYSVKLISSSSSSMCWMTQNLRYIGGQNGTASTGAARANGSQFSSDFTMTNSSATSYTAALYSVAGNGDVFYNFCAATGRTVCTNSASVNEASSSICPAGWRLPTRSEGNSYSSGLTSYGGFYSVNGADPTFHWTSTTDYPYNKDNAYSIKYYLSTNTVRVDSGGGTQWSNAVRCVRAS